MDTTTVGGEWWIGGPPAATIHRAGGLAAVFAAPLAATIHRAGGPAAVFAASPAPRLR